MLRVTAAELDERRILAPARRLIARLPVAAGGGRGRLTTPARTPQVGGPATLRRLRRAAAPREREIQREILVYLNATPGIYAWKAGSGLLPLADGRRVRMGKAGVSDVIGLVRVHREPGSWRRCPDSWCSHPHVAAWLAVEVGRPGKKATPLQLAFLARLKDAGSPLAMVATSVDQVRRAVEAL